MSMSVALSDAKCSSCGLALGGRGTTHFICPDCAQASIGRCRRCRDQSVLFHCPNCGFEGP